MVGQGRRGRETARDIQETQSRVSLAGSPKLSKLVDNFAAEVVSRLNLERPFAATVSGSQKGPSRFELRHGGDQR